MISMTVESVEDLFAQDGGVPKELLKNTVIQDVRENVLIGVLDNQLEVDLEPADGSDILIKKIDPEKSLGYRVFPNENSYFSYLDAQLYTPQESDFSEVS